MCDIRRLHHGVVEGVAHEASGDLLWLLRRRRVGRADDRRTVGAGTSGKDLENKLGQVRFTSSYYTKGHQSLTSSGVSRLGMNSRSSSKSKEHHCSRDSM